MGNTTNLFSYSYCRLIMQTINKIIQATVKKNIIRVVELRLPTCTYWLQQRIGEISVKLKQPVLMRLPRKMF